MVTVVISNSAQAALLANSMTAATITLPVSPSPAWVTAMSVPAASRDRHGPARRATHGPTPPTEMPPGAATASSSP